MKIKIKISRHLSKNKLKPNKMDGLNSINSNTLNNRFCKKQHDCKNTVCYYCYAIYGLHTFRINCIDVFNINDDIFTHRILHDREIPFLNYGIIRYNSYGEIINDYHFINYCTIAKNNNHCTFTLFTKREDIIKRNYKYIPDNMILIYSSPVLNKQARLPKFFNKVFTVYTDDYYKLHNIDINCIGQCKDCKVCYSKNDTIYIHEIVRSKEFLHFDTIRDKIKWTVKP